MRHFMMAALCAGALVGGSQVAEARGCITGAIIGGAIAAPFAAWLVKHLPGRVLGVAAGGLIVLTNSKTIVESLGGSGQVVAAVASVVFVVWISLIATAVRHERIARAAEEQERDALVAA